MAIFPPVPRLLDAALRAETVVRVERVDGASRDGRVLALGRRWVLLAQLADIGHPDGITALRLRDIDHVTPAPLSQRASAHHVNWPPDAPAVDLDSTRAMLASLLTADTLVGIECIDEPGQRWYGLPHALRRRHLDLWELSPQCTWHATESSWRLSSLAEVAIGDRYGTTLGSLAAEPPLAPADSRWAHETDPSRADGGA
ncbi:hypothetical protein IGS67_06905 [Flavimobilis sp. GY10621]|uniref:Uncharacterized protein n=1 Tax=Flavimobilis rhizosphaerae TaxID=2775421 RepID=A0ABR9DS45_9MICO|nr:hypothetical protein [Flavimobilis rhizosphaerae]MBD9699221.1 hypothetical protein [Flavimobilis rhizosphaerae]